MAGMRRSNPESVDLARRAAILSILTGSGTSPELAEVLLRQWEADASAWGEFDDRLMLAVQALPLFAWPGLRIAGVL